MMTIEELRRALDSETADLRTELPVARVRRRARWIRRRQALTVAVVVLAVTAAGGIYKASVPPPAPPAGPSSTTLYYSDGTTVLATIGDPDAAGKGGIDTALSSPVGHIVNHVLDELTHTKGSPLYGRSWDSIRGGKYAITTTIDQRAQQVLERTADETVAGSLMNGQPAKLRAAGVIVEPGTGRVRAYYGGHDGASDYAGIYQDSDGAWTGFGAHPAGSAFFPHTLAAALRDGISLNSRWDWAPHDMPGRTGQHQIRNHSRCGSQAPEAPCTLLASMNSGLNVPFYAVTLSVSPAKVLEMARDAGIDWMWADDRKRCHLAGAQDMGELVPASFDTILGLGQYPITVLDQANAMATYAADGRRATAHFVERVGHQGKAVFSEVLRDGPPVLNQAGAADLSYALSRNSAGRLPGRDSAVATGAWEFDGGADQNAHAWTVGYTRNLAMAVWIGNAAEERALVDKDGKPIWGSGLPASIYRTVMTAAHDTMNLPVLAFPAPAFGGRLDPPFSVGG